MEGKSRHGSCFGYCVHDGPAIIISSDRDEALDYVLALTRGEIQPHDELIEGTASADADEITDDESLTAPDTDDSEGVTQSHIEKIGCNLGSEELSELHQNPALVERIKNQARDPCYRLPLFRKFSMKLRRIEVCFLP